MLNHHYRFGGGDTEETPKASVTHIEVSELLLLTELGNQLNCDYTLLVFTHCLTTPASPLTVNNTPVINVLSPRGDNSLCHNDMILTWTNVDDCAARAMCLVITLTDRNYKLLVSYSICYRVYIRSQIINYM